ARKCRVEPADQLGDVVLLLVGRKDDRQFRAMRGFARRARLINGGGHAKLLAPSWWPRRCAASRSPLSGPIVRFDVALEFGFREPDGLQAHGNEEWGLVGIVRRVLVEGGRTELVDALRRELAILVPGHEHDE